MERPIKAPIALPVVMLIYVIMLIVLTGENRTMSRLGLVMARSVKPRTGNFTKGFVRSSVGGSISHFIKD